MRCLLNDKKILAIKPSFKRQEYWDTSLPSFGIRVAKSGQKTFFVMCRERGQQRRVSLGRYPIISLSQARDAARDKLRLMSEGSSVTVEKPTLITVNYAIDQFIELYAKKKNKDWQRGQTRLRSTLSKRFGSSDITEVKRRDIIAILDEIVARDASIQANRILATLSKFFKWCIERGYVETSPVMHVTKPSKENKRDRVLSDPEVSRVWEQAEKIGYPFGAIIQILLLTGQRKGEVTGMRWSEINVQDRLWTIPKERSKNGHSHSIPLTDNTVQILQKLPRFLGSEFVFTTTGRTAVSGFGRVKANLDREACVQDWVIHDLRRTVASGMARLKVPPYTVEKILNHVSGTFSGVAGVYNRYGYDDEKRIALQTWNKHISEILANGKAE